MLLRAAHRPWPGCPAAAPNASTLPVPTRPAGKAAHWAYKEAPPGAGAPATGGLAAASTTSDSEGDGEDGEELGLGLPPLGVEAGHPLLYIRGGRGAFGLGRAEKGRGASGLRAGGRVEARWRLPLLVPRTWAGGRHVPGAAAPPARAHAAAPPPHPPAQPTAGGRLRDAVVVRSEFGGRRLLCAVSQAARAASDARPAAPDEYRCARGVALAALLLFVLRRDGWGS